jgi:hypothetical protein
MVAKLALAYSIRPYIAGEQCSGQVWYLLAV